MATRTIVRMDTTALKKRLVKELTDEQTNRLIVYAMDEIKKIGKQIETYHAAHHMDRTGNLLNSLCWGVSYQGKLQAGGYYREPILRDNGIAGTSQAYLHEWFGGEERYLYPVDGRKLASRYVDTYGNNKNARGWKVFFAILAPYWGYWEKGFHMESGFGHKYRFMQFAVMTQFFDEVKADLKPARVRFRVSVAKYNHDTLRKRWNKRAESSWKFGKMDALRGTSKKKKK